MLASVMGLLMCVGVMAVNPDDSTLIGYAFLGSALVAASLWSGFKSTQAQVVWYACVAARLHQLLHVGTYSDRLRHAGCYVRLSGSLPSQMDAFLNFMSRINGLLGMLIFYHYLVLRGPMLHVLPLPQGADNVHGAIDVSDEPQPQAVNHAASTSTAPASANVPPTASYFFSSHIATSLRPAGSYGAPSGHAVSHLQMQVERDGDPT
jgi:hypothetical protein